MKINNIEELFKYIIDSYTTETRLYISGLLSDGAIFKNVPIILNGDKDLPTDIVEPEYVKRIKKLEVISGKSFFERTKYVLTHMKDKDAFMDIRALRNKSLVLDYNPLKIWLDYSKKLLNLGVKTLDGNVPSVLAICDDMDLYFTEYDINGMYDPFVTEIKDEDGNILFENKYNDSLIDLQNTFRLKKISYIIENIIYYYREEYLGEIRKEDAVKMAVDIVMSSECLLATSYSAFKPYIIETKDSVSKGYLTDYIGPYSQLHDYIHDAVNIKVDGDEVINPIEESKIIVNKFNSYDNAYDILEAAQNYVFSSLNLYDEKKLAKNI